MEQGTVLSLCDRTAIMVTPWAAAGFECICVDVQHEEIARHPDLPITYVGGDVREWLPPKIEYKIVFAFPPCENRADLRSETPAGFARAVFEANVKGGYVEQTELFLFGEIAGL